MLYIEYSLYNMEDASENHANNEKVAFSKNKWKAILDMPLGF